MFQVTWQQAVERAIGWALQADLRATEGRWDDAGQCAELAHMWAAVAAQIPVVLPSNTVTEDA
jgi:hypothetical protein